MTGPNNNTYLPGTIFIPSSLTITGITKSFPMVVTISVNVVTEANTYIPGMLVRLLIPYDYGMFQANGLTGQIIEVDDDEITLNIDSTNFDTFTVPEDGEQPASLSPSGSRNLTYSNETRFIAFQPLNDRGN